jgi:neutral ceramidase
VTTRAAFAAYLAFAVSGLTAAPPKYRVGVATVDITPTEPIRLSGYSSRTRLSDGVNTPLHAKALAIRERAGQPVIIVTTDLIGLPRAITDVVAGRAMKDFKLERASLLFNSSHTHAGPWVRGNLPLIIELSDADRKVTDACADRLTEQLYHVIADALAQMEPASLALGYTEAHFAMNRRKPAGPARNYSDPQVPVLRVTTAEGKTKAVLFGYACHNTTLTGDNNMIDGDYAGYAQQEIEKANPNATALFVMLAGADQNPNPRGTLKLAQEYGQTLAAAVNTTLHSNLSPLTGKIRAAFQITELTFAPLERADYQARLSEHNPPRGRHARAMLDRMDRGDPIRRYPYPVQAVSFGNGFTIVALGGEVLVDYALRIKRENPGRNLMIAGYSNDVMAYIPSKRVLAEGGYEVLDSMYYYGLPGPWAEDTEERIMTTVHAVLARVSSKSRTR